LETKPIRRTGPCTKRKRLYLEPAFTVESNNQQTQKSKYDSRTNQTGRQALSGASKTENLAKKSKIKTISMLKTEHRVQHPETKTQNHTKKERSKSSVCRYTES
jgi:hypothetical protein